MKTALAIFLVGATIMLIAERAFADLDPAACKTDAAKFCPGVKPGGGAIETCLKKNESALTPACKQYRQEVKGKVEAFAQACASDIKTKCGGVQPGGGRVLQCLKKNETALSPGCKSQMVSAPK